MSLRTFALNVLTVLCMMGCYDTSRYQGDGHIEDRGVFDANYRYVVTVAQIPVGTPGQFEFTLKGLPLERFYVGLNIGIPDMAFKRNPGDYVPCNPRVQIWVKELSTNKVVLDAHGYLATDWTWSYSRGSDSAFLYIREGADRAFQSVARRQPYVLGIRVDIPLEESCDSNATIVLKSSGWK